MRWEFLTDQGLAHGNPQAAFEEWLAAQLAELPAPVAAEVCTWAEALQGRGPRAARARDSTTIQGYIRVLHGPLASWATRYASLREVTTSDLTAELTALTRATRLLALSAIRSLFGTLKGRRVLFTDPAAPLTGARPSRCRSCHSMTACAQVCSAACTISPSGSSCCWPECTRCAQPTSAP